MLTRDERTHVEDVFATALAEELNPRTVVTTVFAADADPILLNLPITLTRASEIAAFVVASCLDSGWTKTPALLELLLDYLIQRRGIGDLAPALTRVKAKIDPNPSLYDVAWMSGQRPFFDRTDFRQRAKALVGENGRPILRITSAPDSSGRTYGTRFLEHLSDVLPDNVRVVSIELTAKTGPSYRPEDLASVIATQLELGNISPARSSSDYPATAALWILGKLMERPGRWVVVLDGFGQELQDETRLTIEALAAMVPTGQYRRRVRLVLVDYHPELPAVTLADTLEESLAPVTAITASHVQACLDELNAFRQREGREILGPAEVVAVAAGLLALAPATGKERLIALNEKLIRLYDAPIAQILGGPGGGG